jgi:hypothetical protein
MTQLPVGKKDNFKFESVKRGDLLKLVTGETVIFEEMKRTRFACTMNKKGISVPLYRDRSATMPFVTEIVGHNGAAIPTPVSAGTLVPGNLFIMEGKKGTYMYQSETAKNIVGLDISTRRSYNIRKGDFTIVQIHLEEIYKECVL